MYEHDQLIELKVESDTRTDYNSTSSKDSERLLKVVLNNELDEIEGIIVGSRSQLMSHKYPQHNHKTILIIACVDENVSKDTLSQLYKSLESRYNNVTCIDEDWYKWEPLHYVARMADPEKLEVLVENLCNVNSLTTFSENALHIVLEYEESVIHFKTLLYNGGESKDCAIISMEKENTEHCAKILIKAGVDVNHKNFWNETPICLAARYRYTKIIQLLLETPYIDLDNCKEGELPIREYLSKNYLSRNTLPHSISFHGEPVTVLFDLLKSGDEDAFLQYNNENIKDYVHSFDGDSKTNSCGNMLHFCFKKGFLKYIHSDLYNQELVDSGLMDTPMLNVFCTQGYERCIEHLLNNGANPNETCPKFPETLLEAAAVRGYYPLVAVLLQHKYSKIKQQDIYEILPKLFIERHDLKNHTIYRRHVLFLLLNKLQNKSNEINEDPEEILNLEKLNIFNETLSNLNLEGDEAKGDDTENICQILKLGATLTKKVHKEKLIIKCINPNILRRHFDDCINNNMFHYNSLVLDTKEKYSETKALSFLAKDPVKRESLTHPLLIHFLHNKWLKIFWIFYLELFIFTCFLLGIYAYMLTSQLKNQIFPINVIFYTLLTIHIFKETMQLIFLYHWKYFSDLANYLEFSVIISCITSIFYPNEYTAVTAILFSTVIFFMMLGQLPIFTKYTIIFGSTKYFIQYAGFYFTQFISFALVFYIIFPFKPNPETTSNNSTNIDTAPTLLGDIFKSLFYTLILFTGDFSDRVLEPDRFPVFGRIIITIFIFFMTIILNNLLVGLIVADMDEMQREGKLYKQVKMAMFISRTNYFVKRLDDFRSLPTIRKIINFLHAFKKGKNKILNLNDCIHKNVFDENDQKYLKEMKNRRYFAYDKDGLRKLYDLIQLTVAQNTKER